MKISTLGVLGAGTMGGGIALVGAQAGLKVILKVPRCLVFRRQLVVWSHF